MLNHLKHGIAIALLGAVMGCSSVTAPSTITDKGADAVEPTSSLDAALDFFAAARQNARAEPSSLEQINAELRAHDRMYTPIGEGPFPVMLFFHGCSGPTLTHEEDWAEFLNANGVAVLAVDSYTGRDIDWNDVCNFEKLTPWERASDVLATLSYVRDLDQIDSNRIGLMGFSHGAISLWSLLEYESDQTPPINLENWPDDALDGVSTVFSFYGGCAGRWTTPVVMVSFLGGEDRYIDESTCVEYVARNPDRSEFARYEIYANATHTFDHAAPNQANIDAGSRFDPVAVEQAKDTILSTLLETGMIPE